MIDLSDENWKIILSALPQNWKQLSFDTKAVTHKVRGFKSIEALLRTILIHVGQGFSLRETVVKAKLLKLANVSDVALLARLRKSKDWLESLCNQLIVELELIKYDFKHKFKLKAIDGSVVKEPGKTGREWRLHLSLTIPELNCDYLSITPTKGKGNGESFLRFPIVKGDCILADRGYSTVNGIEYVHDNDGYIIMRLNTQTVPIFQSNGENFELLKSVQILTVSGETAEYNVFIKVSNNKLLKVRLCILRKTDEQIQISIKKIKRASQRDQTKTKDSTLEYAKYVLVLSNISSEIMDVSEILNCYRMRWQVELIFKRLKSLLQFGHLPTHNDESSVAWLYGKLLICLLSEKLIRVSKLSADIKVKKKKKLKTRWREFEFMSYQVRQSIDKNISLKRVIENWNQISNLLAEKNRKRIPQLIKNKF